MNQPLRTQRRRLALLPLVAALALASTSLAAPAWNETATAARARSEPARACAAATVQYTAFRGAPSELAQTPWVEGSPPSAGLVGYLFYWGSTNWGQQHLRLSKLRIYTGGKAPGNGVNMKILWQLRHTHAHSLQIEGRRSGGGTFTQRLPGGQQFPSIISIPVPGCWHLTLTAGPTSSHLTLLAISRTTR